ncbi:MAG: MBL fold metallo-hydrolase [Gammaproteobacteria bacterium]|jgi:glyoxylase-like metal-dependent hydrolase (beta-lactamase superfamily II)|nr:MBL fold metallo-hydrolase [Gammaproteobacteria bacterium]
MKSPIITKFFDPDTFTLSYIVADPNTQQCAIIDAVLNYSPNSGRIQTTLADKMIAAVKAQGLSLQWLLETHVHADHLSAAPYIKEQLGGQIAIGANIKVVQHVFADLFNAGSDFHMDGSQFDKLLDDKEVFMLGDMEVLAISTPGHTPACMTFVVADACFVGDTLFMPDFGTARCDFPGGDVATLWDSLQRILSLPDQTRLFMCHDYMPAGRELQWQTTVAESKTKNIHLAGKSRAEYIALRKARDAQLDVPQLLMPSVQVNMRAGRLPPAEDNGINYLKIPINKIASA